METFNFPVQTKPRGEVNFRRRVVGFGEGYSQKIGDGLNTKVQNWNLTFDGDQAQAQQLMDFLDRHAGVKAFEWTPPGRSVPQKFTCPSYTEVPHVASQVVISMIFEEDFRP